MLLKGVTVVEWSEDIASQYAARLLADLGAKVIRFEPPGGGALRREPPAWPGDGPEARAGALYDFLNAGKTCRTLDPGDASAPATLERALGDADALVQSGLASAFPGLSVPALRARRPSLVVLSISQFGRDGAAEAAPMSDFVLQHHAGLAHSMARPVSDPEAQPPLAGADHEGPLAVGVCGALAAVWGLLITQSGGRAPEIDLASQDFYAQMLLDDFVQWNQGKRQFPRDRKSSPSIAPAGGISWLLPARDGHIMVSPREEHQWQRWMAVLGHPDWSRDAALCGSVAIRKLHWRELQERMAEWSQRRPAAELAAEAQSERVACFPVSTPAELLANAQLLQRQFFDRLRVPGGGEARVPGLPFQIVDTAGHALKRDRLLHAPRPEAAGGA